MSECENLAKCSFLKDSEKMTSGVREIYKHNFCLKAKEKCARYLVANALGMDKVPEDLLPNMGDRVKRIISGK